MKTEIKKFTINELVETSSNEKWLSAALSVIPNNLGINLCAVKDIEFECEADEKFSQLVSLKINFIPAEHTEDYDRACEVNNAGSWKETFDEWSNKLNKNN